MTALLAFVYEKVILLSDQLETDGSDNIHSISGGL